MKDEDLVFTIDDGFGREVECRILSMFKKNNEEILVIFFDDERDISNNIVLKYGKLLKIDDEYELVALHDEQDLVQLKRQFKDDLYDLPNLILNG